MAALSRGGGLSDLARRFGPITNLAAALALVVLVLPSALNLPQSNPNTTPEFAPVPPKDQNSPNHVQGNLAGLGTTIGSGFTPGGGQPPAPTPPPLPPPGDLGTQGKTPSTKLCVGNPPRQTEDPLSPPCVGYFAGDNGGATAVGVTRTEVRLLFAFSGGSRSVGSTASGNDVTPTNAYFDLCKPRTGQEDARRQALRVWQAYFNQRYQAYGRRVCMTVYYAPNQPSPEGARAAAAENYQKVHPFAVYGGLSNYDVYDTDMAGYGAVTFDDTPEGLPRSFYSAVPGHAFGYAGTLEEQAAQYSSYVCSKVVPFPVSNSGANYLGKKRSYGFLSYAPHKPTGGPPSSLEVYSALVKQQIERCGVHFDAVAHFPLANDANGVGNSLDPGYAQKAMAEFSRKNITTIIWAGSSETSFSNAAKSFGYFPEWILGSTVADGLLNGTSQDQDEWAHAMVVTPNRRVALSGDAAPCDEAYGSVVPGDTSLDRHYACLFYDSVQQMFIGIQVAGPKLTATSLDQGFHAIPGHPSSDPDTPACFYDPGDYTCVKDATVVHWDATAVNREGTKGCYRFSQNGLRYLAGRWPTGDIRVQWRSTDICDNNLGGGAVG